MKSVISRRSAIRRRQSPSTSIVESESMKQPSGRSESFTAARQSAAEKVAENEDVGAVDRLGAAQSRHEAKPPWGMDRMFRLTSKPQVVQTGRGTSSLSEGLEDRRRVEESEVELDKEVLHKRRSPLLTITQKSSPK